MLSRTLTVSINGKSIVLSIQRKGKTTCCWLSVEEAKGLIDCLQKAVSRTEVDIAEELIKTYG